MPTRNPCNRARMLVSLVFSSSRTKVGADIIFSSEEWTGGSLLRSLGLRAVADARAMNPAVYVGLFMIGAAIAAALPRPLQEDRRATNEYRKQKRNSVSSASSKRKKAGGTKRP